MADWSLPITTTLYTAVLTDLDARLDELATMFDGATPTNLPTGTFRINGSSNNLLQKWSGSVWNNQALSVQTLKIGADGVNAEATVTDLDFGADANIAAQGNLNFYIDSNNDQTDRLFRWYHNAAAVTGAALLMQLTEAGALSGLVSVAATTFTGALVGNADTVTTNANLTGEVTSVGNVATLAVSAITGKPALTTGLAAADELLLSDNGVIKRMDISVMNAYFNANLSFAALSANTFTGKQDFNAELAINAGYSEDDDTYTVTTGTKTLDTSAATYFHPTGAMTAVAYTFAFSNPAASGRVTSFTLELNSGGTASSITWPTSVDWAGGAAPIFTTSGIDLLTFITRDGGTTWLGFISGLDMK